MKKAIIRLNTFISKQKIYIYEDSTHIDTTETKIGEIAECQSVINMILIELY